MKKLILIIVVGVSFSIPFLLFQCIRNRTLLLWTSIAALAICTMAAGVIGFNAIQTGRVPIQNTSATLVYIWVGTMLMGIATKNYVIRCKLPITVTHPELKATLAGLLLIIMLTGFWIG